MLPKTTVKLGIRRHKFLCHLFAHSSQIADLNQNKKDSNKVTIQSINLAEKLATFSEYYKPRTIGQFNGNDLMVVKVKGPFNWHKHEDIDDFFLVLSGHLTIQLRDGNVELGPGELYVIPKGVEHCPVAEEETHVLLIEPQGTPNTGNPVTAAARLVI